MKTKKCLTESEQRARPVPKSDRADAELAQLAWAVAHPARARILRILLARSACVCGEIVDQLTLAQSTVSQHLKILKEAGLIQGEIEGPKVCYCVNQEALARLKARIEEL
jgi:ArsR family transcriptional regulator